MAHQMGGFEENKVIANFDILDNFDIMSIIAVGYQDKADKLNEELYKLEISERKRRLLGDNFFDSEMNNPIA
jgi:hypothetical protein